MSADLLVFLVRAFQHSPHETLERKNNGVNFKVFSEDRAEDLKVLKILHTLHQANSFCFSVPCYFC